MCKKEKRKKKKKKEENQAVSKTPKPNGKVEINPTWLV